MGCEARILSRFFVWTLGLLLGSAGAAMGQAAANLGQTRAAQASAGGTGEGPGRSVEPPPAHLRPHHPRPLGPAFRMGLHGRWWNEPQAREHLGLSTEQSRKMDDIFNAHRLERIDAMAALEKSEAVLDPLTSADLPNEAAILGQIDKVAEARAVLQKTEVRMDLALRAQLTHNQWMMLESDGLRTEGGPPRGGDEGNGRPGEAGPRSRGPRSPGERSPGERSSGEPSFGPPDPPLIRDHASRPPGPERGADPGQDEDAE